MTTDGRFARGRAMNHIASTGHGDNSAVGAQDE